MVCGIFHKGFGHFQKVFLGIQKKFREIYSLTCNYCGLSFSVVCLWSIVLFLTPMLMPIRWSPLIETLRAKDLQGPNLSILQQDSQSYQMLLFQPKLDLGFEERRLFYLNEEEAEQKFSQFLSLATESNVELAVTPEYSCPWSVLASNLENGAFPNEGRLWVLGCQSITVAAFKAFIAAHPEVEWIHEDLQAADDTHFLDSVCYFMQVKHSETQEFTRIGVVQFKTHHFGGEGLEWERDGMHQGSEIYILQNQEGVTSRLFTLICSDAINPAIDYTKLPEVGNCPYTAIHIQLNKWPFSEREFSKYRKDRFDMQWEFEFICLNWSPGLTLQGFGDNWNSYGGSALYTYTNEAKEAKEFDFRDETILANHSKGLYFTHWKKYRAYVYFLNYNESVFLIASTKIKQNGAPVSARKRTGAKAREAFVWNQETTSWQETQDSLDDGFMAVCQEVGDGTAEFFTALGLDSVDLERFVTVSTGRVKGRDWWKVIFNPFFILDRDEKTRRLTFAQDPDEQRKTERVTALGKVLRLKQIVEDPDQLPEAIKSACARCALGYDPRNRLANLYSLENQGVRATGAYISETSKDTGQKALDDLINAHPDGNNYHLIAVWFSPFNGNVECLAPNRKPQITDDLSASTTDFNTTRR